MKESAPNTELFFSPALKAPVGQGSQKVIGVETTLCRQTAEDQTLFRSWLGFYLHDPKKAI